MFLLRVGAVTQPGGVRRETSVVATVLVIGLDSLYRCVFLLWAVRTDIILASVVLLFSLAPHIRHHLREEFAPKGWLTSLGSVDALVESFHPEIPRVASAFR